MPSILHLDFETYSPVELKKYGLDNYARKAEVLMLGWAFGNGTVRVWQPHKEPMPIQLRALLEDPNQLIGAWNAQFERVILKHALGIEIPPERFRCTMVRASLLSLPMALDKCGRIMRVGSEYEKNAEGKRLIQLFCKPRKPTKNNPSTRNDWNSHPEEWKKFVHYCAQDVIAERHIDERLKKYPIQEEHIWKVYAFDQRVNDRGVPIDMQFVNNAIAMVKRRKDELKKQINQLTGLKNANSPEQLLPWLRAQGYPFSDVQKDRLKKAKEDFKHLMTADCLKAIDLRLIVAKTSVTKYNAMRDRVGPDGRLRYAFQMAGAGRTMRWAGRGVQLQNLARTPKAYEKYLAEIRQMVHDMDYDGITTFFGDPIVVLAGVVRTAIAPKKGRRLVVADLNAIETRLGGWISGCKALDKVFEKGLCPYKDFGTRLYNKKYEDITPFERSVSKPGVLGCGYMLSGGGEVGQYPDTKKTGLWAYAESMGVKIAQEDAARQVKVFRETYKEYPSTWTALTDGLEHAIQKQERKPVSVLAFDAFKPFARMELPSGRHIYYLRPKVKMQTIKHAGGSFEKMGVQYEGRNKVGNWSHAITTHGGKLLENACQAIGVDILVDGAFEAEKDNFFIIGTLHDEIICEHDDDDIDFGGMDVDHLCAAMIRKNPSWQKGLRLAAAGYDSPFYKKD